MRRSSMVTPFRLPSSWSGRRRFPLLEEALSGDHVDLVLEDTDSPSNLAATGQNDVLVRLRPEQMARELDRGSRGCGFGQRPTICG